MDGRGFRDACRCCANTPRILPSMCRRGHGRESRSSAQSDSKFVTSTNGVLLFLESVETPPDLIRITANAIAFRSRHPICKAWICSLVDAVANSNILACSYASTAKAAMVVGSANTLRWAFPSSVQLMPAVGKGINDRDITKRRGFPRRGSKRYRMPSLVEPRCQAHG